MNKHFRSSEAKVAENIIEEGIESLKERLRYLTMRPVMVQLHEKMNFLRQKVLKRAFAKLPELTDKERRIIDIMTQRLEHKFLREPMTAMNSATGPALKAAGLQSISPSGGPVPVRILFPVQQQ